MFCGAGRECAVTEKGEPTCLCIEVSPKVGSQRTVAKAGVVTLLELPVSSAHDFIIFIKAHLVCLKELKILSQKVKIRCECRDTFLFKHYLPL